MRRLYLIPFALIAVTAFAQEEGEEEEAGLAAPQIIAFTMSDGSAPSKELEAAVGKIRGSYEEKAVLFLTVNLSTAGGKNQGEMLFFSLGLPQIWNECKKAVGRLVIVNLDTVTVLAKLGAKENISAALDQHIESDADAGEEGCAGGD